MPDNQKLKQIITALEKANMQLTSLGVNNTNFCTDAIKLARELDNQESPSKELEEQKGEDLGDKLKHKMNAHIEDLTVVGIKVINDEYCTDDIIDAFGRTEDLIEEITEQLTTAQQALDSVKETLEFALAGAKVLRTMTHRTNTSMAAFPVAKKLIADIEAALISIKG